VIDLTKDLVTRKEHFTEILSKDQSIIKSWTVKIMMWNTQVARMSSFALFIMFKRQYIINLIVQQIIFGYVFN